MDTKNKKIIFMGTTEFAGGILKSLLINGYNVIGVVCQPDKPVGRKKNLEFSFTKKVALENNIDIFQPFNIKEDNEWLVNKEPDLIITCAYGQIVPQKVLDLPPLGCINVHGSLLPKLRGAAPIQYAILNDLKVTGVTIMNMVKKMDVNEPEEEKKEEEDLIIKVPLGTVITNTDTGDSLFKKMEEAAALLLIDTLDDYIDGKLSGEKQDEESVSFAPSIKREEEIINWNDTRRNIYNKIRALNSVPGAYTLLEDLSIKVFSSEEIYKEYIGECGEIVEILKDRIFVKVKDGAISICEVQPSGKKRMSVRDFLNGNKDLKGKIFHD